MLEEKELESHIGSQRLSHFLHSGTRDRLLGKCQIAVITAMFMSVLMLGTWYWMIAAPLALIAAVVHGKKNMLGRFRSCYATRMSSLPLLLSSISLGVVLIGSIISGVKWSTHASLFGGVYVGIACVSGWLAWRNVKCYWALSKRTLELTENIPNMYKHAQSRANTGHEIMNLIGQDCENTLVVHSFLSRLLTSNPKWGVILLDQKLVVVQKIFSRDQYTGFCCGYEHCDIHVSVKKCGRAKIDTPYATVRGSCDLNECKQFADCAKDKGIKIET